MSGARSRALWPVAGLLLALLAVAPAAAQEEMETSEDVLGTETGESDLPKGATFNYRSRGYVDPFLSPDNSRTEVQLGQRPPGIRGMRVEEISVKGIFDTEDGPMAMFLGSDADYYSLKVGDRLYDGYLIEIDLKSGAVWFRQENPDRTALKPYRDVSKTLYPEQEVRP